MEIPLTSGRKKADPGPGGLACGVANDMTNRAIDPLDSKTLTEMVHRDYKINGELLKKFGLGIYKKE